MPFLGAAEPYVGLGLSGLGGLFGNNSSQSSAPSMDPAYGPLQSLVLNQTMARLAQPTDLSGYTGTGMGTINRTYNAAGTNLRNTLTARGLSTSPVAGAADATLQTGRAGALSDFENSVPLLAHQLQTEDLGQAGSILGLGRGVNTTASQGGGASGVFNNVAGMLGYLQGKGAFGSGGSGGRVNPY